MDIEEMRQKYRTATQVSSKCSGCKGLTACTAGDMRFNGCVLDRKPGACAGPFPEWDAFWAEADKDDDS